MVIRWQMAGLLCIFGSSVAAQAQAAQPDPLSVIADMIQPSGPAASAAAARIVQPQVSGSTAPDAAALAVAAETAGLKAATHGSAITDIFGDLSSSNISTMPKQFRTLSQSVVQHFCSMTCDSPLGVPRCGTSTPGSANETCIPAQDSPLFRATIGNGFGPGRSPFVDSAQIPDSQTPAGYTFFGQFIDHDLTRTAVGISNALHLLATASPFALANTFGERSGFTANAILNALPDSGSSGLLDLDSVYGVDDYSQLSGLNAPWFERNTAGVYTGRFALVHRQGPVNYAAKSVPIDGFDYYRDPHNDPYTHDPRNNENRIIAQIQSLFMFAHNNCMDTLESSGAPQYRGSVQARFDRCHALVQWVYQAIVSTDFLPRILSPATLAVINGTASGGAPPGSPATLPDPARINLALYTCTAGSGKQAGVQIPLEFAAAAYRLGHTLVRDDYQLAGLVKDPQGEVLTGERRPIFASRPGEDPATGLAGTDPLRQRDIIDWSYFFDLNGKRSGNHARPLDALISERLFELPVSALPPDENNPSGHDTPSEQNLPRRNFLRSAARTQALTGSVDLATGEQALQYGEKRSPDIKDNSAPIQKLIGDRLASAGFPRDAFGGHTPLWLWILAEAEATEHSQNLGVLGSHLVGEFLSGSLKCDTTSVLYQSSSTPKTGWQPADTVLAERRFMFPQLIEYLQAHASVDGHPIKLFN